MIDSRERASRPRHAQVARLNTRFWGRLAHFRLFFHAFEAETWRIFVRAERGARLPLCASVLPDLRVFMSVPVDSVHVLAGAMWSRTVDDKGAPTY